MWLAAGSAAAAPVLLVWLWVLRNGGRAPGADTWSHAGAAEWLRTRPWHSWRGWSDWFFGGQAVGVNYPPLGHWWLRVTDPVHGQFAAVLVVVAVLLPWGALHLARACGYPPRAQRAAVVAMLVTVAAAGAIPAVLEGLHAIHYYSSWPGPVAMALCLFAAAWAARCERPVACGLVLGVAALFNPSYTAGGVLVCAMLLASSPATVKQAVRWAIACGASAAAVSAWWVVPFVAGRKRLVSWDISLTTLFNQFGFFHVVLLAGLAVACVLASRQCEGSRRLAGAAVMGLGAALCADLFGQLRPERWMHRSACSSP